MKTQTKILTAAAFAAALLGGTASAAGISPVGQFASTTVALRSTNEYSAPRAYSVAADAAPVQTVVVKAHNKSQAPSAFELHSLLVRAPVNPEVVRAQGE